MIDRESYEVAKIKNGKIYCTWCHHETSTHSYLPMEAVLFASFLNGWTAAHDPCKAHHKKALIDKRLRENTESNVELGGVEPPT